MSTAHFPIYPIDPNHRGYAQMPQGTLSASALENSTQTQAPNQNSGRFGTRNQFTGVVTRVIKGETSAFVEMDIGGNNTITSLINLLPLEELGIQLGSTVTAVFQPADVILYAYGSMN